MEGDPSQIHKSALDLVKEFNALEGDTLKERERNLYAVLRRYRDLQQSEQFLHSLTTVFSETNSSKRRTHLQDIFFIDTLIYFKHIEELWKLFKAGDEIACNKLGHKKWFFGEVLNTEDFKPEEFVEELLPTVSHSVRLKLLNKLRPRDENRSDQVFDALLKRYGLSTASLVFHNCSKIKIREILSADFVPLSSNQLQHLVDKDFDLFKLFLHQLIKFKGNLLSLEKASVLNYVAQKYPEKYLQLLTSFRFNNNVGRRTTKKIVVHGKELILKEPKKYAENLHIPIVIRKLGVNFRDFLLKIFPKKTEECTNADITAYLKHCTKNGRYSLFRDCFNSTFQKKLGDDIDVITTDILELISDAEFRQKLAKMKFDKEEDEKYLRFFKPAECFSIIRQKLTLTSNSLKRNEYVQIMMKCCILSQDYDLLFQGGMYFTKRFKNDVSAVFSPLFSEFFNERNALLKNLQQKHWDFLLQIFAIKKADGGFHYNEAFFGIKYLEYLLRNEKPVDEFLENFAPDIISHINDEALQFKKENVKFILNKMLEKSPIESKVTRRDVAEFDARIFHACLCYNKNHPKDPVEPHSSPRLMESWKMLFEGYSENHRQMYGVDFAKFIETKKDTPEMREMVTLYFKNVFPQTYSLDLPWFLVNRPDIVKIKLPDILTGILRYNTQKTMRTARLVKKYSHMGLDSSIREFLTETIQDVKVSNEYKQQSILFLTTILPDEDLLEIVENYKPTSDKVDITNFDLREDYLIQCEFVMNLKRLKCAKPGIPLVLKFCVGDYLGKSLGTLYSFLSKIPENEVGNILEEIIAKNAVSLKKHGLSLSLLLLDHSEALQMIQKSPGSVNLWPVLKYFAKNPSEDLWQDVERMMKEIDVDDNVLLIDMSKLSIPLVYKERYNYILWSCMTKGEKKKFKSQSLRKLRTNDRDFAAKVIANDFLVIEDANIFVANFLLFAPVDEKFEIVKKRLEVVKEVKWTNETTREEFMQKFRNFVKILVTKIFQSDKIELQEKNFSLLQVFNPIEAFREYVWIQMLQCKGKTPEEKGKIVTNLANHLVSLYGTDVLDALAWTVASIYAFVFKEKEYEIPEFCHSIFQSSRDLHNYLFVIYLFRLFPPPEDIEGLKYHDEMLKALKSSSNNIVLLNLNMYLARDYYKK